MLPRPTRLNTLSPSSSSTNEQPLPTDLHRTTRSLAIFGGAKPREENLSARKMRELVSQAGELKLNFCETPSNSSGSDDDGQQYGSRRYWLKCWASPNSLIKVFCLFFCLVSFKWNYHHQILVFQVKKSQFFWWNKFVNCISSRASFSCKCKS